MKNISLYDKIKSFPFLGIGFMLLVIIIFWTKIIELLKPKGYEQETQKPLDKLSVMFLGRGWISKAGNFMTQNGKGGPSKYIVSQAQNDALLLAGSMDTSKRDSWYERIFSLSVSPSAMRVKSILNPNYPSTYRRYVIQAYSDIYTNNRDLQTDARKQLISIAWFGDWSEDLKKYFIL